MFRQFRPLCSGNGSARRRHAVLQVGEVAAAGRFRQGRLEPLGFLFRVEVGAGGYPQEALDGAHQGEGLAELPRARGAEDAGFGQCDYHNMTGGIVALHRGIKP